MKESEEYPLAYELSRSSRRALILWLHKSMVDEMNFEPEADSPR